MKSPTAPLGKAPQVDGTQSSSTSTRKPGTLLSHSPPSTPLCTYPSVRAGCAATTTSPFSCPFTLSHLPCDACEMCEIPLMGKEEEGGKVQRRLLSLVPIMHALRAQENKEETRRHPGKMMRAAKRRKQTRTNQLEARNSRFHRQKQR